MRSGDIDIVFIRIIILWRKYRIIEIVLSKQSSRLNPSQVVSIVAGMTALTAKVIALEKPGDHYQAIVQIITKYRGSFNTLAFGEIKPYSGSLKKGRLDLVYYRDPGLKVGDDFPVWTLW